MTEDLQRIRRLVTALARRERALILGRVALRSLVLLAALVLVGTVAASWHWDRPAAAAAVVLLFGAGAWAAVVLPLLVGWRAADDPIRQARLVERLAPDLRGRLITAVERTDGPVGQESAAMLGLVARRAADAAARVPPQRVHPGRPILRLALVAMGAWTLALVASLLTPGGPLGALRWWFGDGLASAAVAGFDDGDDGEKARVGDLVLLYTYPAYTGLEPREIDNSTGDAHGPPGTTVTVTARSARVVDAAALIAYDEPALEAEVREDGRVIVGAFTIGTDPGTWRFVTWQGEASLASRDFAIEPEPDLPPEVMLDASKPVLEVAADERMPFLWNARDDYGLSRVVVEIDGREIGAPLAAPSERRAEVGGQSAPRPLDLGLQPGQRVRMTLAAWDNDTVSGSKVGRSQPIEIIVLGERGVSARDDEVQRRLRDLLVDILAGHLVERWPPGRTSGDVAAWGEVVADRYEPMHDFIDETWKGRAPPEPFGFLLGEIDEAATGLVRFTQVAFLAGSKSPPNDDDLQVAAQKRDELVRELETTILAIDQVLQERAWLNVQESAERLADVAEDMKQMLAAGDADAQEMLTRLDHLERALDALMQDAAKLQDGSGIKEFVNARENEMRGLIEEIREAIAAGRMDEARELMERLAEQIEQMSEGVLDQMNQQRAEQDETMQQAAELQQELSQLAEDENKLREELETLREQADERSSEQTRDLWAQILEKADAHVASAEQYTEALERARGALGETERAKGAADMSARLRDAIARKDLNGSFEGLEHAEDSWQIVRMAVVLFGGRRQGGPGERDVARIERQLQEIRELLEQLEERSNRTDPQTQRRTQELEQRQQELQQRLEQAQQKAEQVTRQMQTRPEDVGENLEQAGDAMEQAREDLREGRPMPAEGSAGSAAEKIEQARDALQEAMEREQQLRRAAQQGRGGQQGERGNRGEGPGADGRTGEENQPWQRVEIPGPEEFKTPEEYRRELLEGMEGEVPEEYRALKKRYYEELVHQ